jgi:allantoicase
MLPDTLAWLRKMAEAQRECNHGMKDAGQISDEAADEIERLRKALEAIKILCAGDAAPHWNKGLETTKSRVAICDMVDIALGNTF